MAIWGDYDGDHDLDIVITGTTALGNRSIIYRNDSGQFIDIKANLPAVGLSSSAWGDFDRDGDLDLVLTGELSPSKVRIVKIFRNDGDEFTDTNAGIEGVTHGSTSWGDFDRDGDLDLLLTGLTTRVNHPTDWYVTRIYRNDDSSFTNIGAGLDGIIYGSASWGDFDVDGDLDILLAGDRRDSFVSKVYKNDSGVFTDINGGLTGIRHGFARWGDCDNDGDLDILLSGQAQEADRIVNITKIYVNDRGKFSDIEGVFTGLRFSSGSWGDYNSDGFSDFIVSGSASPSPPVSLIYKNNGTNLGAIPGGEFADDGVREAAVAELRAKEEEERQLAAQFAADNDIIMRGVDEDNRTFELDKLSEDDGSPLFLYTDNVNAAISTAVNQIRDVSPYEVNGTNQLVGIWDGGSVLPTHQVFQINGGGSRIHVKDGASSHYHATHVGGTIGANAIVANATGMAPGVQIDSYDWSFDESEMMARAASTSNNSVNIYISNHSYGFIEGWRTPDGRTWYWYGQYVSGDREDRNFGQYGSQSQLWDSIVFSAPYYLPFKSAGNDRNDNPRLNNGDTFYRVNSSWQFVAQSYNASTSPFGDGYDNGGFDTISGSGISKNVMTVGAVNDAVTGGIRNPLAATMTSFSGWGPADDGRIKPDIVANGYNLYSAHNQSTSAYAGLSGTSMSSPNAAGTAILLQEYHKKLNNNYMLASTLKGPHYSYL